ncbi:MAG TPA: hypothetical protein VGI96_16640 [Streptosporangiaceae bacterium]
MPPGHESAEPPGLDLSPRGWLRPRAGDQAPGGRLVDPETGNPVLLHDVFRGPQSTLLLFGGADTAVTGAVRQAADAGRVACVTILRPDQPPGRTAGRVLTDPRGQVARDFGARPGTVVMVRPDGHIGLHAPRKDAARGVAAYLRRVMADPAAS